MATKKPVKKETNEKTVDKTTSAILDWIQNTITAIIRQDDTEISPDDAQYVAQVKAELAKQLEKLKTAVRAESAGSASLKVELDLANKRIAALQLELQNATEKNKGNNTILMNVCSNINLPKHAGKTVKLKQNTSGAWAKDSKPAAIYAEMVGPNGFPFDENGTEIRETTLGELIAILRSNPALKSMLSCCAVLAAIIEDEDLEPILACYDPTTTAKNRKGTSSSSDGKKTSSSGRVATKFSLAGSDLSKADKGQPHNSNVDVWFTLTMPDIKGPEPSGLTVWRQLQDTVGHIGDGVHAVGLYSFLIHDQKLAPAKAAGLVWSMGLNRVIDGKAKPIENGPFTPGMDFRMANVKMSPKKAAKTDDKASKIVLKKKTDEAAAAEAAAMDDADEDIYDAETEDDEEGEEH